MSPSRFVRYLTTVAVVAAAGIVGASPAEAAPVDPPRPLTAPKPGTSGECAEEVGFHGYIGHKICGTGHWWQNWPDGHERFFVIGLDHAVWNIARYPDGNISGWRSLGGWLQGGVTWSHKNGPYDLGIFSFGADGRVWCNDLNVFGWSNWYLCQ